MLVHSTSWKLNIKPPSDADLIKNLLFAEVWPDNEKAIKYQDLLLYIPTYDIKSNMTRTLIHATVFCDAAVLRNGPYTTMC